MRRGASIRALLLGVNGFVLLVPLLAVVLLRIYDNQLVRQTEKQLIAESVLIGEVFREALLAELEIPPGAQPRIRPDDAVDAIYFPIEPVLDLNDGVLPPTRATPPRSRPAAGSEDAAFRAGQRVEVVLERAKLVNLSSARLLDPAGCVVATSGGDAGLCLEELPEVKGALRGHYSAVMRQRVSDEPPPPIESISRRGKVRVYTATPLFADGKVIGVVRMSRTSLDPGKALWVDRGTLAAALLGCALLTLGVSLFLSRAIARPVREITAAAAAIARGEPRTRLLQAGVVPAEVRELSDALDRMTALLSDRADYIAEFAANVSHELKTPLTSIRGAAELLRDSGGQMSEEERRRFLQMIDEDAGRMDRLVRGLLALARIQSAPAAAVPVLLPDWLRGLADRYAPQLQLELTQAPASITINPDHLESAVRNLVENAVRHGAGKVVRLTARSLPGGRVELVVRDQGPGISEGNLPRIFDRFFTTERDRGGSGLGLAMVKAVAETRGGSVTCSTGPGGTAFTLVL